MSTYLRFVLVLFSISVLISMGILLLAGSQFYELIFLDEQDDQSFWVLDFRNQIKEHVKQDDEVIDSLAQARQMLELEGAELKLDLGLDFPFNKDIGDYSNRLMLYEFADHHGYVYAITNPDFDEGLGETIEDRKREVTFAGYGYSKHKPSPFVLICMIKPKNDDPETIAALDRFKKSIIDQSISIDLELKDPIVWGQPDWRQVWLLGFNDREFAVSLLDSQVFQSELLIAATFVEDLALAVYR